MQIPKSIPAFGIVAEITETRTVSLFMQPVIGFVAVSVSVKVPIPANVGLKIPDVETPVPDHDVMHPTGVTEKGKVIVPGKLQNEVSFPALITGNGLTFIVSKLLIREHDPLESILLK